MLSKQTYMFRQPSITFIVSLVIGPLIGFVCASLLPPQPTRDKFNLPFQSVLGFWNAEFVAFLAALATLIMLAVYNRKFAPLVTYSLGFSSSISFTFLVMYPSSTAFGETILGWSLIMLSLALACHILLRELITASPAEG